MHTRSHLLPSFLRRWEREGPRESPLGDFHGRGETPAGPEITRPTEKTAAQLGADFSHLKEHPSRLNRSAARTPARVTGFNPGGKGDMWLAQVLKETDPRSSQRDCCTSRASAPSREPRGDQGWLKVTQWPAGSQAGPAPGLQAPPSLQTQICRGGEEGGAGLPSWALAGHRGPVLCRSTIPLFAPCQATASLGSC